MLRYSYMANCLMARNGIIGYLIFQFEKWRSLNGGSQSYICISRFFIILQIKILDKVLTLELLAFSLRFFQRTPRNE